MQIDRVQESPGKREVTEMEKQTRIFVAAFIAIIIAGTVTAVVFMNEMNEDDRETPQPELADTEEKTVSEDVQPPSEPEKDAGQENPSQDVQPPSESPVHIFYEVMVFSGDESKGMAFGSGTYEKGSRYTISAVAFDGYEFTTWSDGNTDARRTMTADSDLVITACFKPTGTPTVPPERQDDTKPSPSERQDDTKPTPAPVEEDEDKTPEVPITASPSDASEGSVVGGGTYPKGTKISLEAVPSEGYEFDHWVRNGTEISGGPSIEVTASTELDFVAYFSPATYTVTVTAGDVGRGTVSGGGSFANGEIASLSATVDYGYSFGGWYVNGKWYDGNTSCTVTVNEDMDCVARFNIIRDASFTLSAEMGEAMEPLTLSPRYDVAVKEQFWDAHAVEDGSGTMSMGESGHDRVWTPYKAGIYEIVRTVTYEDGSTAESSKEVMVDGIETKTYTWTYQHDYYKVHDAVWGLISWTSEESEERTAHYSIDLRYSEYRAYRDSIEAVDQLFISTTPLVGEHKMRAGDIPIFVTYQDPVIKRIASDFNAITASMPALERAQFVLNFVTKAIQYSYDGESIGIVEYYRFPYETLWEDTGDCEDTAFLYATLMKAMGYDVIIIDYPKHVMAAVADVPGCTGYYYDVDGKRYYACETTGDVGYFEVGYLSPSYTSAEPKIVKIQ